MRERQPNAPPPADAYPWDCLPDNRLGRSTGTQRPHTQASHGEGPTQRVSATPAYCSKMIVETMHTILTFVESFLANSEPFSHAFGAFFACGIGLQPKLRPSVWLFAFLVREDRSPDDRKRHRPAHGWQSRREARKQSRVDIAVRGGTTSIKVVHYDVGAGRSARPLRKLHAAPPAPRLAGCCTAIRRKRTPVEAASDQIENRRRFRAVGLAILKSFAPEPRLIRGGRSATWATCLANQDATDKRMITVCERSTYGERQRRMSPQRRLDEAA